MTAPAVCPSPEISTSSVEILEARLKYNTVRRLPFAFSIVPPTSDFSFLYTFLRTKISLCVFLATANKSRAAAFYLPKKRAKIRRSFPHQYQNGASLVLRRTFMCMRGTSEVPFWYSFCNSKRIWHHSICSASYVVACCYSYQAPNPLIFFTSYSCAAFFDGSCGCCGLLMLQSDGP